jgi:hypothetical protein
MARLTVLQLVEEEAELLAVIFASLVIHEPSRAFFLWEEHVMSLAVWT